MRTGRSSFRELFGDGRRVEIPVIQRDYAQGREDEHSREVRRRFLEALGKALLAEGTDTAALDLDFVYGRWRVAERTLEPLDGQQRLTTLFLLHWYLASLDDVFDEFRSWITLSNGGACFTYRTRPAAREFFDALVRQRAPLASYRRWVLRYLGLGNRLRLVREELAARSDRAGLPHSARRHP